MTHKSHNTQARPETDHSDLDHPLIPASRVRGADLYNQANEKIGKIEDVVIDKRSGKVAYAIVSFGGFIGLGEKHQPLSWSSLSYDTDLGGYVAPITAELLEMAPKLDPKEVSGWDHTADRDTVFSYYGSYAVRP